MQNKVLHIILICLFFTHTILTYSQVGINTSSPFGVLHIDPLANTSTTIPTSTLDDLVVDKDGNLGLGVVDPQVKIDIKTEGTASLPISGFRLEDGNQGAGKALTIIESQGLLSWKQLLDIESITFVRPAASNPGPNIFFGNTNFYWSNSYIDLPPGRWILMVLMYMTTGGGLTWGIGFIDSTFADTSTFNASGGSFSSIVSKDIEGGGLVSGSFYSEKVTGGLINGSIIINNETSLTKRYFYFMGNARAIYDINPVVLPPVAKPGGTWGEDNIVAFKIPSKI